MWQKRILGRYFIWKFFHTLAQIIFIQLIHANKCFLTLKLFPSFRFFFLLLHFAEIQYNFQNCASIISFKFFTSFLSSGFFTSSAYSLTILYQSFSIIFFLLRLYIHTILYFSFFFHLFIFWTVWCQETFYALCVCVFVCIQDILWDEKKIINISLTNCNIIKNYYLWIHECTHIHTHI